MAALRFVVALACVALMSTCAQAPVAPTPATPPWPHPTAGHSRTCGLALDWRKPVPFTRLSTHLIGPNDTPKRKSCFLPWALKRRRPRPL